MAATESPGGEEEDGGAEIGGYAVAGADARGPLVRGTDGALLSAVLRSRDAADEALQRGLERLPTHEHRESLVDLAVHPGGVVLVTTPPIVTTLERVLESGRILAPGVVVTILAPVVAALRDAASHGVRLAPAAEAIGMTADGRPVLLLSECVSAASSEEATSAVRDLLGRLRDRCPEWPGALEADADLEAVEALLYRTAVPLPLGDLLRAGSGSPSEWTGTECESAALQKRPRRGPRLARRVVEADPGGASARHRRTHPLDGWRDRVTVFARRRRGPLLTAAVVLLGAIVATGLSPAAPSAVGSAREERLRTASSTPSITPTAAVRAPAPELTADEAAAALLAAVAGCGGAQEACVAALTTADSPLREDDATPLSELVPSGAAPAVVLAQVNGASALVAVERDPGGTTAASVLMIRTEAGWLIRDVFADRPR